ncbi:hypothetical protein EEB18_007905 [Sphingopyxis sp. OPL5]|uniref:hypothetical protein n=1 Tax=Sphingopyxis sp. OPL5 TaxID=2486273 RepID=UPI00164DC7F5|nr:hypothetical protein [Sphingopyxis sp. OPL5]QNO28854.1 hypothetical protein EEB18_007905 [Sphingopyxis sp. OPL5]
MRNRWIKGLIVAGALMLVPAAPVAAQQDLAISHGEAWTHAHSGITVPATLGGNALTKAKAYAQDELDVGLSFEPEGAEDYVSFYIFRNTNGGVPVWFAQAQWAIENRDQFGKPGLIIPPQAFIPPGQTGATGLKAVYQPHGDAGYKSTGLALLPFGDWYVKIRITSRTKSPQQLSALIDGVLNEIRWPTGTTTEAPVAVPIADCTPVLDFPVAAKDAPQSSGTGIAEAFGIILTSGDSTRFMRPKAPATWCRDSPISDNQRLYRPNGSPDHYLVALGDNGNAVLVGTAAAWGFMPPSKEKPAPYSIQFVDAFESTLYAPQDRLPSPDRVIEIINANRVVAKLNTWGKNTNIEIASDPK